MKIDMGFQLYSEEPSIRICLKEGVSKNSNAANRTAPGDGRRSYKRNTAPKTVVDERPISERMGKAGKDVRLHLAQGKLLTNTLRAKLVDEYNLNLTQINNIIDEALEERDLSRTS